MESQLQVSIVILKYQNISWRKEISAYFSTCEHVVCIIIFEKPSRRAVFSESLKVKFNPGNCVLRQVLIQYCHKLQNFRNKIYSILYIIKLCIHLHQEISHLGLYPKIGESFSIRGHIVIL